MALPFQKYYPKESSIFRGGGSIQHFNASKWLNVVHKNDSTICHDVTSTKQNRFVSTDDVVNVCNYSVHQTSRNDSPLSTDGINSDGIVTGEGKDADIETRVPLDIGFSNNNIKMYPSTGTGTGYRASTTTDKISTYATSKYSKPSRTPKGTDNRRTSRWHPFTHNKNNWISASTDKVNQKSRSKDIRQSHLQCKMASCTTYDKLEKPQPEQKEKEKRRHWKMTRDPKTNRVYYYDILTRETQWNKPIELSDKIERGSIKQKELKQKEFFRKMEANMLHNLVQDNFFNDPKQEEATKILPKPSALGRNKNLSKGRLVRTISSMDTELLTKILSNDDENQDSKRFCPLPTTESCWIEDQAIATVRQAAEEMAISQYPVRDLTLEKRQNKNDLTITKINKELKKPKMCRRRNTCGTMYVSSTMSAPDMDATIRCVCGVLRVYIHYHTATPASDGAKRSQVKFDEYEIFNDHPSKRGNKSVCSTLTTNSRSSSKSNRSVIITSETGIEALCIEESSPQSILPTLEDIVSFFRFVFYKAQMETDCIIMSLIYVERLMRETNGGVRPTHNNWRSIIFSCMVMASKVWDDLSMWNADFSQACPKGVKFTLPRINELELTVLGCLKYDVKVKASEYAKYYFFLRSMVIRSGLAGKDLTNVSPLDIEGARKLEVVSAEYKTMNSSPKFDLPKRSVSVGIVEQTSGGTPQDREGSPLSKCSQRINLEQVVNMK